MSPVPTSRTNKNERIWAWCVPPHRDCLICRRRWARCGHHTFYFYSALMKFSYTSMYIISILAKRLCSNKTLCLPWFFFYEGSHFDVTTSWMRSIATKWPGSKRMLVSLSVKLVSHTRLKLNSRGDSIYRQIMAGLQVIIWYFIMAIETKRSSISCVANPKLFATDLLVMDFMLVPWHRKKTTSCSGGETNQKTQMEKSSIGCRLAESRLRKNGNEKRRKLGSIFAELA